MVTGQCPPSTLKFPLSLFPKALDLPRPHPYLPPLPLLAHLALGPPLATPPPRPRAQAARRGFGEPQAGFVAARPWVRSGLEQAGPGDALCM